MNRIKTILCLVGCLTILPSIAMAESFPSFPMSFYGEAKLDNNNLIAGTKIQAHSDNTLVGEVVMQEDGIYGYNNPIKSKLIVGEYDSMELFFKYILPNTSEALTGNNLVKYNYDFEAGNALEFNLLFTENDNSEPDPPPSGGGGPSGGGNPSGDDENNDDDNDNNNTPDESEIDTSLKTPEVKGETDITILDGDIIQCQSSDNPFAVYIVKIVGDTKYIRHIVSLEIFNYYGHLQWENLKQVEALDDYSLSGWVRYNTGANYTPAPTDKVYEINGDQSKHWINMTAEDFLTHGGSEEAIYSVNQGELNLYTTGADVMSL